MNKEATACRWEDHNLVCTQDHLRHKEFDVFDIALSCFALLMLVALGGLAYLFYGESLADKF